MGQEQSTPISTAELLQDATLPQEAIVSKKDTVNNEKKDAVSKEEPVSEKTVVAVRERSRSVSPAGFRNRKVELKNGYLVVSEKDPDSACTSVMGDMIDEWENVYMKHRDDIIDENGFISTPLHCVKQLAAKLKMEVHIEHYILDSPDKKNNKTLYRVDILMGPLRGSGQCTRKQLAKQLAAIDVYEKLQLQQTDLGYRPTPMPRCALLPGWRVDEMVFPTLFNKVCKRQNLGTPVFKLIPPPDNHPGKFLAICKVGEHETRGENDHPWLAKRLAAKEMYEVITGHEFRLRATPIGCDVLGFPQMRLLGFDPQITNLKRKWMMDHRIQDTQIVLPADEPDDGEMADVEEEFQNQQSKKFKLCDFPENFKITFNQLHEKAIPNLRVTAIPTTDQAPGPSDLVRKFVACNNTLQEEGSANFRVTIRSGNNNTFPKEQSANFQVTVHTGNNNFEENRRQVVQSLSSSMLLPTTSRGFRAGSSDPHFSCKQESILDGDDDDFEYGDFNSSDEEALLG